MHAHPSFSSYKAYAGAISVLSTLIAGLFVAHHQVYPSVAGYADAWSYQFYAFRFRSHGFLYDFGTLRTYGYPFFLYILTFVSGFDHDRLSLVAGVVQFILFFAAVHWLASLVNRVSRRLAYAILIGLLLNPILLSLVTDALTDGLSIVLYVTLVAIAVWFGRSSKSGAAAALLVGAFVVATALVIRPANIIIVIAWYLSVIIAVSVYPANKGHRGFLYLMTAFSLLVASIALAPQFIYNLRNYGEATFFPVCRLGDYQASVSITVWKYDTIVGADGVRSWFYLNPLLEGNSPAQSGWLWYLQHPVAGVTTMLAHVFNAFSVTNLFAYVRDLSPSYGLPLRLLYWTLSIAGIAGAARYLRLLTEGKYRAEVSDNALPLMFVVLSVLGTIALASITAVEVRFNIVSIATLSVIAVATLWALLAKEIRLRWFEAAVYVAVISVFLAASYAMDRLGTADMAGRIPALDPVESRCFSIGHHSNQAEAFKEVRDYETLMNIKR